MIIFPDAEPVIGNFDFGFSGGGEEVRLFNANNDLIDHVIYDDDPPWPTESDGEGPTLELINPDLDNAMVESWSASDGYGSPGAINSSYLTTEEEELIPTDFVVNTNFPNPFNSRTTISYELPDNCLVSIVIYDVLGRKVKSLVKQNQSIGIKSVMWDATNDNGQPVATGVYFYSVRAGEVYKNEKNDIA